MLSEEKGRRGKLEPKVEHIYRMNSGRDSNRGRVKVLGMKMRRQEGAR